MLHTPSSLRGMVVSPHHLASNAGLNVLRDGGSASEAAVATAATLAVVYPHMTSIGGDSFWMIREADGSVHAIDACGAAAAKAELSLYRGMSQVPWRGPLAANTVAGTISGWQRLLKHDYCRLPLERLLSEAIYYAKNGVVVTEGGASVARTKSSELGPISGYAEVFMPQGQPLRTGDILKQPALAHTLVRLAREGLESFYHGALAREIAADLQRVGAPVSLTDLANHRATTPLPLTTKIKGAQLYNTAPPTQGFASLMILALQDRLVGRDYPSIQELHVHDVGQHVQQEVEYIHGIVEATKRAFILRDKHIGDPAWMNFDPQALLNDHDELDKMAGEIDLLRAMQWPHVPAGGDTVWFGAIDEHGRAVSAIQSTYFEFGSGVVLPQSGIVWQNRGCSFRLSEDGWNCLKPGRKPFHTLNPALSVFDNGRVMVYGTMGGEGQPQTQAAVFTRYASGMGLQAAITAPRWLLGRTWGEASVSFKLESRFDPKVGELLQQRGHFVEWLPPFSSVMGHAGAVVRHVDGRIEGAVDPRSDGGVAAW